ncbi:hypothetical protein FRC17_009698 [Serendipita sp. 399]|nr:hypothetical protein FRC17_009698 [Serendipita sp. 399]
MPKKKTASGAGSSGKAAAKAAKKAKAAAKVERKETKKVKAANATNNKGKSKAKSKEEDDDDDLEGILARMQKEWELAHTVTEETAEGPPSRRANATLTPCPVNNHLWCIGGEYFSEDGKAVSLSVYRLAGYVTSLLPQYFYNDVYRYSPDKDEWRKFATPTCPGPRSAHAVVASPASGGKLFLFGGYCKEYVKGKRPQGIALDDTWLLKMDLDLKNIKWEKRKKIGYAPSIRSGCTMALWSAKGMGVLFGGVYDDDKDEETLESVFYNDLYGYQTSGNGRWVSLALRKPKKKPGGGRKAKRINENPTSPVISDRRDPSDDEDYEDDANNSEKETEDLSKELSPPQAIQQKSKVGARLPSQNATSTNAVTRLDEDIDPDDPDLTTPLVRYNAMLAVLKNTLYIYGGIYERGAREYTLDDFYTLPLDKLDRYVCLKESGIVPEEGVNDESDEDDEDDDDDGDDDESDEEEEENRDGDSSEDEHADPVEVEVTSPRAEGASFEDEEVLSIRKKAQALLKIVETPISPIQGNSSEPDRIQEPPADAHITPLPGETLSTFYTRTKDHWAQKARSELGSENRGKSLRRDGFALAEERWTEYKPILDEIERIRKEAGVEEESSMARAAGTGKGVGESRNRR